MKIFLGSSEKLAFILESDAIIRSSEEFRKEIVGISDFLENSVPSIILLSEGFTANKLGVRYEEFGSPYYSKHEICHTNMLSAYIINRKFAELICMFKSTDNSRPLLPFDWLVNHALAYYKSKGVETIGFSTKTQTLIHGSFKGNYTSWQVQT